MELGEHRKRSIGIDILQTRERVKVVGVNSNEELTCEQR